MTLKSRINDPSIVLAPGICDGLTAALAQDAGAEAVYLSGAAIAYSRFGRPDIGLVSMAEVADTLAIVRDRIDAPIIVDADTGFGNALNVQRTVRVFERVGANAIQLEDQTFPKRCGHLDGKGVIPLGEAVGKIRAALDARVSEETVIIARTDALAVEGMGSALERAHAFAEAGADMIFLDALRADDEMTEALASMKGVVPLMANMVEGGKTPPKAAAELEAMGFALVIFPGGIVRALAKTASEYYDSLVENGTTAPFMGRMLDFDGLNAAIGTPDMLARGKTYE